MTEKTQKDSEMSTRLERAVPSSENTLRGTRDWQQEMAVRAVHIAEEEGWVMPIKKNNLDSVIESIKIALNLADTHFNKEIELLKANIDSRDDAHNEIIDILNKQKREITRLKALASQAQADLKVATEDTAMLQDRIKQLKTQNMRNFGSWETSFSQLRAEHEKEIKECEKMFKDLRYVAQTQERTRIRNKLEEFKESKISNDHPKDNWTLEEIKEFDKRFAEELKKEVDKHG